MSYTFDISTASVDSIFGTAYPHLSLSYDAKGPILASYLHDTLRKEDVDFGSRYSLSVNYSSDKNAYRVTSGEEGRKGFKVIRRSQELLSELQGSRNWPRTILNTVFLRANVPTDIYYISDLDYGELMAWLIENARPRDYQIFSRYGKEHTLGFKCTELSTMFKLSFEDIERS